MVDPAVGVRPGISGAYDRGSAADIWVKNPDGTEHRGSKSQSPPNLINRVLSCALLPKLSGLVLLYGLIGSTTTPMSSGGASLPSSSTQTLALILMVSGLT